MTPPTRRDFLKHAATGLAGAAGGGAGGPGLLAGIERLLAGGGLRPVDSLPADVTRTWIGPPYWSNRLQDWRLTGGRIECVAAGLAEGGGRTMAVLTREMIRGPLGARLSVRTGTLAGGPGFSGFLVGAGEGLLDWRAAALVQRASGRGGGLLCVYGSDGRVRFREHTDEADQLAYAELPPSSRTGTHPPRSRDEDVELHLAVTPEPAGTFKLRLYALDFASGAPLSEAVRHGVAEEQLAGGLALVSSNDRGVAGARYWFRGLRTSVGDKIAERPERAEGAIAGVLFSLADGVLKLTAQLFPIGPTEAQVAELEVRAPGGAWRAEGRAPIGEGYVAAFRITGWDDSRDWEFRVLHERGTPGSSVFAGFVPRDQAAERTLVLGLVNCVVPAHRPLDAASSGAPRLPGERPLGLYTDANVYFPHEKLVRNVERQRPDLLVFSGDQLYESKPTAPEPGPAPLLDYLYKWYLWLRAFGDLTRRIPAVVQLDDHDVYQGNVWGHEGGRAPEGDALQGGYVKSPEFLNLVQRVQSGHDPDPFDPTPVRRGIGVYYAAFVFGGVRFALLEDRKFKTGDADGLDSSGEPFPPETLELLGARQEEFLRAWGADPSPGPRVCLTQTVYACVQTLEDGSPKRDLDTNGYPPQGRARAVRLLADAGALVLSGDQHLGSLVRHGLERFTDGFLQFTPPAAGASFQRWFEPSAPLPNAGPEPYTGDFVDAFGNRARVRAVVNPRVSFAEYRAGYPRGQGLGDRRLKREGYGVVRIDRGAGRFVLECWPWDTDPRERGAAQFAGFPVAVPFAEI